MRIKNNTGASKVWVGQTIEPGAYYTIQAIELPAWRASDIVLADIASADLVVNDGFADLTESNGLKYFLGSTVEVSRLPQPQPFAEPIYRTKHNKKNGATVIPNGNAVAIDYVLTEELYVSGGTIVVKNPQYGDWISAQVYDSLGVIPEAIRAQVCENWPVVSDYILGQYLELYDSNSIWFKQGVDTRPLVAKVSAGLSLRLTYHAANVSGAADREVLVNYFLNRKL
jgi:hypothetical protein